MTDKKTLSEQLKGMDLFGISKCELLRELSGYDGCAEHADGNDTKCSECRERQRLALIERIEEERKHEPEPDTLEKVAKDMVAWMDDLIEVSKSRTVWVTDETADPFRKRLEALGVKLDG